MINILNTRYLDEKHKLHDSEKKLLEVNKLFKFEENLLADYNIKYNKKQILKHRIGTNEENNRNYSTYLSNFIKSRFKKTEPKKEQKRGNKNEKVLIILYIIV